MNNTIVATTIRNIAFFIFLTLASMIGGAVIAVVFDLGSAFKGNAVLPLARRLDMDRIFLKDGQQIYGRILSKTIEEITVGLDQGTVVFRADEIARIEQNDMARYFKKAW